MAEFSRRTLRKHVLKSCIEARAALAALKQAGTLIPNQSVLINTIPLLEAQASSEIENIVTTTDALFKYAQLAQPSIPRPSTKRCCRKLKSAGKSCSFIPSLSAC